MFAFYSLIFIGGMLAGSFLNCIIYRLEKGESFLKGRSYCPHCRRQLGFFDLIPVFSFVFLRGKCRYCRGPISWQYPLIELATGLLFALNFLWSDLFVLGFAIIPFLVVIFVYDLKHYLIPDKVVYPAIAMTLIYDFWMSDILGMSDIIISAVGAAGFFLAIVLISREKWMGMGDVKLAFLIGLLLGWPDTLVALFLAVFSGAMIGIGLMALGKKKMKSEVPFGPFLVTGTFLALFWADEIINWYLNVFTYI